MNVQSSNFRLRSEVSKLPLLRIFRAGAELFQKLLHDVVFLKSFERTADHLRGRMPAFLFSLFRRLNGYVVRNASDALDRPGDCFGSRLEFFVRYATAEHSSPSVDLHINRL